MPHATQPEPHKAEMVKCKKCGTPVSDPIKHPLPFLTSGSAIDKLLAWVRSVNDPELISEISKIIDSWLRSGRSPESYKLEIVIAVIKRIGD